MSSGGGGGPTTSTVNQTNIPEYARPYVEQLLGQGQALTNTGQNPYQAYQGDRFAQFTPMQQQSFQGAQNLGVNPNTQQAGAGALGAAGQAAQFGNGSFTQPGTAGQYMSPYMQNVVDIQKREAGRQADIAGTRRGAQFAQSGAFGGGRQAIEDAEANRNLATQMGDIQATGQQAAFQNAQQQYNAERAQGLQGLSTALQGYGIAGQLGQQEYGQQMGAINLQNQFGGQQQGQVQNILNAQRGDYLDQQNYPYKQLGFMSDLLRGTQGLGQQNMYQYQAAPSMLGQAAGIGMLGKGLGMYKDGGSVKTPTGLAELAISRMA